MPEKIEQLAIRECRSCKTEKVIALFVNNHIFKDGKDTICLDCSREKVKIWRKENPEKRKLQLQKESKKDYNHNKHLKATYGITRDDYVILFDQQNGCCAICNKHQLDFTKRLSVDHCHNTGKIRSLLCSSCNSLLGQAKEDISILQKAIEYIKEHNTNG